MKFKIEIWKIKNLIEMYNKGILDLDPPYQRNDIWAPKTKEKLIESIAIGYPLPAFFIYKKSDELYEMVDGQQRTRTFLGFDKGIIQIKHIKNIDDNKIKEIFENFLVSINLITEVGKTESIEDLFFRVNKFGTEVNRPESLKAMHHGSNFQKLIEEISNQEKFLNLNLFTDSKRKRMEDFDFIAELLALLRYGISEKKNNVDKFYDDKEFSTSESNAIKEQFMKILDHFCRFNNIKEIKTTRYRQKSDFYTFFSFLNDLIHESDKSISSDTLDYFYKLLVIIGPEISPANYDCYAFQDYATNCVSQSNSKRAREARLSFFKDFLLNNISNPLKTKTSADESENVITDIMNYFHLENDDLINIEGYYLPSIEKLEEQLEKVNS